MASSKDTLARDLNETANLLSSEQPQIDSILSTSPTDSPSILDPLSNFNDDFDSILLNKKAAIQESKKQSAKSILNKKRIEEEQRNRIETELRDRAAAAFTPGLTRAESSPVVEVRNEGRLRKHEDGTYTVTTLDGRTVPGLSEYDARTFSAWSDANIQGLRQDAPEEFFTRKATGIARTTVDIGLQGSLAFLGGTTLAERVDSYNKALKNREFKDDDTNLKRRLTAGIRDKETEDLLNKAKAPAQGAITQEEINQYRSGNIPPDNPKYAILQQLDADAIKSKESFDKFSKIAAGIKEKLPYNMRDQAVAREAYQVIAENEGNWAAMWHAATNYTGALLSQGIDSVPWMVAFTIGGPFAQTMIMMDLAKGRGREAIEEFRTKYDREPTMEEASRIKMWSAIGTVAEKFGDLAAIRAMPGKLSWIKRIQTTAAKSTPLAVLGLATLRIPGALIGEGISGAATAVSEQMASEGEITDTAAIGYDALAEAFGTPGGVASMYAGKAAIGAAKIPFKPSKLEQQLATIEENLANADSATYGDLYGDAGIARVEELNTQLEEALKPDVKAKIIEEENEQILAESEGKTDPKSRFSQKHSKSQAEAAYDKAIKDAREEIAKFENKLETKLSEEDVKSYKESQEKDKADLLKKEEQKVAAKTEEGREARIKEIDEEINEILDEEGFPNQAKLRGLTEEKEKLLRKSQPLTTRVKQVFKDTSPKEAVKDREYIPIEDDEFAKIVDSIDIKKLSDPNANPDDIIAAINEIADIQKKREVTASQEDVLERIRDELSGYAPEQKETLNSIKGITNANDETLERLQRIATTEKDKEVITAEIQRRAKLNQLKTLEKQETKSKTLKEVHADIEDGESAHWTGIHTYYDRIVAIAAEAKTKILAEAEMGNQLGRLKTHIDNLRRKRDAFTTAYKKPPVKRGYVRVVRGSSDNRVMTYKEEVMSIKDYNAERKKDGAKARVNAIVPKGTKGFKYDSTKLIEKVTAEVAYGEEFVTVLDGFSETSFARAEAELRAKGDKLRSKQEDLKKAKFKPKKALLLSKEARDKLDEKFKKLNNKKLADFINKKKEALKKITDKTKKLQEEAIIQYASLTFNKRQDKKKAKTKTTKTKTRTASKTPKKKEETKREDKPEEVVVSGLDFKTKSAFSIKLGDDTAEEDTKKTDTLHSIKGKGTSDKKEGFVVTLSGVPTFGIHQEGKNWSITHIPSGLPLVPKLRTLYQAKEGVRELVLLAVNQGVNYNFKETFSKEDGQLVIKVVRKLNNLAADDTTYGKQESEIKKAADAINQTDDTTETERDTVDETPVSEKSAESASATDSETVSEEQTSKPVSFIEQLKNKLLPILSKDELANRRRNIASSMERHFDMFGMFFTDLVKPRFENVKGIDTLATSVFVGEETKSGKLAYPKLEKALIDLGVTAKTAKALVVEYSRYRRKYEDIRLDTTDPKGNVALKNPLSIIYASSEISPEERDLPPQLIFAMMLGTLNWINQNPTNIVFRSKGDRARFLYGTYANLLSNELLELKNIGHGYVDATDLVGNDVSSLLNLAPADNAAGTRLYSTNLRAAFGLLALQIEHGPTKNFPTPATNKPKGIVGSFKTKPAEPQKSYEFPEDNPRFRIEEKDWHFDEAKVPDRKYNNTDVAGYKHIRLNTKKTLKGQNILVLSSAHKVALKDILKTIKSNIESTEDKPAQVPYKNIVTKVKGYLGGVPFKVTNTLRKLHKVSWTKAQSLDIANILDQNGFRDILYTLADVQHVDKDTNETLSASLIARNEDRINAIDSLFDAYNDPDGNTLEKFYFRYTLQNTHRITMRSSGGVNPQASGVSRYYVRPTKGLIKYNKDKLWKFKLAVVSNFGFEIDKNDLAAAEAAFDYLMADQTTLDAVNAIQNINESGNVAQLAELLKIIHNRDTFGKAPDHGSSILNGLVGLAQGINIDTDVTEDGEFITATLKTNFESDVILEADGISNGFAQNVFQFPMYDDDNDKRRSQTGTYMGKGDLKHDPYQTDAYEDVGNLADPSVEVAEDYHKDNNKEGIFDAKEYTRVNAALTELYKPLRTGNTRKLLKYPFLIFMYGGGMTSIARGIGSEIINDFYVQLDVLQKEYNGKVGIDAQTAFIKTEVTPFLNNLVHVNAITQTEVNKIKRQIQSNKSQTVTFKENKSLRLIAEILEPRLEKGLMSMLGGTKVARDATIQGGEILHAVFMAHYNKAYNEALIVRDEKGKDTGQKRPDLTDEEVEELIKEKLIELLPQYKGPLMQGKDPAFIDLTKRIQAGKNSAGRVNVDFNRGGKKATISANPRSTKFDKPGVRSLIRLIINMDSSILTQTLASYPDVLPLHDAVMGDPDTVEAAAKEYNKFYLKFNREYSILDTLTTQMENVLALTREIDAENNTTELMTEVNDWILAEGFVNDRVDTNKRQNLNTLIESVRTANIATQEAREAVETQIKTTEKAGGKIVSFQLYMADKASSSDIVGNILDKEKNLRRVIVNKIKTVVGEDTESEQERLLKKKDIEDLKAAVKEEINNGRFLGSINDTDKINPTIRHAGDITKDNILSLFQEMSGYSTNYYNSSEEQNEHAANLESIITKLADSMTEATRIRYTEEDVDNLTQGEFDPLSNRLTVSLSRKKPTGLNAQSPQEVYVHESVHAIVTAALAKNPLFKRRLEKLYRQTKQETTYRIFLQSIPKNRKATKEEHRIAEEQYDYLFNNTENEKYRLDEFLAFAVTNRDFSKHLSSNKSKLHFKYRKEGTLFQKAMDVFRYFIELATDIVLKGLNQRGGLGATQKQEVLAVLVGLLEIQKKHKNVLQLMADKTHNIVDASDVFIRTLVEKKALEITVSEPDTKLGEARKIAVKAGYYVLSKNAYTHRSRQAIYEGLNGVLRSLATEIGEGILGKNLIEQLLRSKVRISKARQETERFTVKWFNSIWKSVDASKPEGMSVNLRNDLTKVIFRTDLSSLLNMGFSHAEIANFIDNKPAIEKELRTLKKSIQKLKPQVGKNLGMAVEYATELGNYMATGNTYYKLAHMNASTIASKILANPTANDQALLDAYATLVALDTTAASKTSAVKSLVQNEFKANPTENGFIDLIDAHIEYVERSYRELFSSNQAQMVKGYIVERIDNLTDMKTGTKDQKNLMSAEGYHEPYSLGLIPGITNVNDTLFIGRNVPPVPYVSAIMSTTSKRNIGTTLTDILAQDTKFHSAKNTPDYKKIKQAIRDINRAFEDDVKKNKLVKDLEVKLRPIYDENDNVTDFRVIMNHATREKLLKPDLEIQNVFAHMQSSFIDRKATSVNDKRTIELLVYEQKERMPDHPKEFIDFLDPENGFIDRYYRLPKDVRMYMDKFTKNGTFMVRKDAINKIFGYQASDFRNAFFLQHPNMAHVKRIAGLFHYILRQVVGYGKDRIVVAMPQVWLFNAYSNIAQLTMRNIPFTYTIHKIIEGFHSYEAYRDDRDRQRELINIINIKKLDKKRSQEAIELAAVNVRLVNNKIHQMSEMGLNSLIVEDLNDASLDGYINRGRRFLKTNPWIQERKNLPLSTAGTIASSIMMTKNTGPYQLMRQFVQLTDFLGRYVMIQHAMEVRGLDFNTAMHEALDAFVLFDEALHPALEALDATGTTVFMSYFLRNQRASRQIAMRNPTGVAISGGIQYGTGIPTLGNVDSSFVAGDITPNVMYLDDLFDEANNPTGADLLADVLRGLFGD